MTNDKPDPTVSAPASQTAPFVEGDSPGTIAQTPEQQQEAAARSAEATVPGYEILGELGRGGMGVVYKARQTKLNRIVALKMILAGGHASPEQMSRFLVEAEAVAALQHPNIVQIFESGTHNGLPYFSLEFVDGGPLSRQVRERPLPPLEAATMVERIARAIAYAHSRGVVHRDLKPDNILLTGLTGSTGSENESSSHPVNPVNPVKNSSPIPKIADFGLAKLGEPGALAPGEFAPTAIMGTPSYMAPEQAAGKVGPSVDIWALGAILYRLLTGRPPFQAATLMETLNQVTTADPVPPSRLVPGLPRDLETICLKCLQKEPAKRYAGAKELGDDLLRYLKHEPILARPVGSFERTTKWVRRNPIPTIAATAAKSLHSASNSDRIVRETQSDMRQSVLEVVPTKPHARRSRSDSRNITKRWRFGRR